MARLIDADALGIGKAKREAFDNPVYADGWNSAIDIIENAPTVDAVPAAAYEQVKWERDMAMKQLEEHGIPFGGIAPDVVEVVRCKDCQHRGDDRRCPMCFEETIEWDDDGYPETECVYHDHTTNDGFCERGERRSDGDS